MVGTSRVCREGGTIVDSDTRQWYLPGRELFEGVEYRYTTIPEWLSLIRYSGFVVTPLFMAWFSVFVFTSHSFIFPLSGTHIGNSRVLNLLSKLSLSDNVWKVPGNFERIYNLPVDWDKVEELLAPLRDKSVSFETSVELMM